MLSRSCLAGTLGVIVLGSAGCTTGGQGFSLLPNRQPLIQEAKAVRQTIPVELPRELHKALLPPHLLEPGDGLLILPADLDSPVRLPSDQIIQQDGTIDLGRYGKIVVAGRTVTDAEAQVKEAVEKAEPKAGFIDVRLVNRVSKTYYVLGEVNTPGKFVINGHETVLDGIIAAGGLNGSASWRDIILVRPGGDGQVEGCPPGTESAGLVLAVRYARIVQLGDTATNYQLAPGDRIFVPTRTLAESLFGHKKSE